MGDNNEVMWPLCDPAPEDSVDTEKCIIVKAKRGYEGEMVGFLKNFGEGYRRSLAVFYSQEAEQKALNQERILRRYIEDLTHYYHALKSGATDAKRPEAPKELYSTDPLEKPENEELSEMESISSESSPSDTSIDLEFMEKKGMISSDMAKQLVDEGIVTPKGQAVTRNELKRKSSSELSTNDNNDKQYEAESGTHAKMVSSNEEITAAKMKSVGEEEDSSRKRGTLKSRTTESSSTFESISDKHQKIEHSEQERGAKILSAKHSSHHDDSCESSASLVTSRTDCSDYDREIEQLQGKLEHLDESLKCRNSELAALLKSKGVVVPDGKSTLLMKEINLTNQINDLKVKLNQLDEAALAPVQLANFCQGLKIATDSKNTANIKEIPANTDDLNFLRQQVFDYNSGQFPQEQQVPELETPRVETIGKTTLVRQTLVPGSARHSPYHSRFEKNMALCDSLIKQFGSGAQLINNLALPSVASFDQSELPF